MANVYNCDVMESAFDLQLHYYTHLQTLGKSMDSLILTDIG